MDTKEKVKEWDAQYYQKHKQEWQKGGKYYKGNQEWRKQHMDKVRANGRKQSATYRQKIRQEIFSMFGNKCAKCGYDTDDRAFQIDHINGGGSVDRRIYRNSNAYYKHILDCKGEGYQLLCANCNQIKCYENREY